MRVRLPPAFYATTVAVALCTPSCIPFPHRERQTPFVRGTLVVEGVPLADARVRVATTEGDAATSCSGAKFSETTTNASGRFQLEPVLKQHFVSLLVMAHRRYEWELCVRRGDGWTALFRDSDYTLVGVPGAGPMGIVELSCQAGEAMGSAFECETSHDLVATPEKVEGWLGS